jgi:hypothetical protein
MGSGAIPARRYTGPFSARRRWIVRHRPIDRLAVKRRIEDEGRRTNYQYVVVAPVVIAKFLV